MALPKQVQQQLDAAESFLAPAPVVPAPAAVAVEPAAEAPASEVIAQPVVVETPIAAPAPSQSAPPAEDWQHKYKTLQGVHNRHVGDLKARVQALEEERQRLILEAATQSQAKPAVVADPKDVDVFGQDLVDMVRRTAESLFGATASAFDGRLKSIEQALAGTTATVQRTAEDMFFDRLAELVPDYETVNADEGFLAWLGENDPIYGAPRQKALDDASGARDVERVARVFTTYKQLAGTAAPAPAARPSPAAQLEKQVAPRTTASQPGPSAPAKKTYTVAQVTAFYKDVQMGKYRGREEEALAHENLLNQALAEGRVVEHAPRPSM